MKSFESIVSGHHLVIGSGMRPFEQSSDCPVRGGPRVRLHFCISHILPPSARAGRRFPEPCTAFLSIEFELKEDSEQQMVRSLSKVGAENISETPPESEPSATRIMQVNLGAKFMIRVKKENTTNMVMILDF